MGDLKGHFAPATILIVVAVWWLMKNLDHYFKCQKAGQMTSFRSMASCPEFPCTRKRYPKIHFEVLLGIILFSFDFLGEFILGMRIAPPGFLVHPALLQHMVMISCAAVRMIVSGLSFYTTWLPSGADHAATGMAFILQMPLLLAHSYDKNLTGITVHVTTAICWFAGGLCSFYEMNNRNNIMATVGRCYFVALGSLWFFHGGGVLMHVYPFNMNHMGLSSGLQIVYLSIYFVTDAVAIILLFAAISIFIYRTTEHEMSNLGVRSPGRMSPNPHKTDAVYCLMKDH